MEYNEEIYRKLANDRGLETAVVRDVCMSMFEFVADTIRAGNNQAVRLPYLGIWRVKAARIDKLKEQGKI